MISWFLAAIAALFFLAIVGCDYTPPYKKNQPLVTFEYGLLSNDSAHIVWNKYAVSCWSELDQKRLFQQEKPIESHNLKMMVPIEFFDGYYFSFQPKDTFLFGSDILVQCYMDSDTVNHQQWAIISAIDDQYSILANTLSIMMFEEMSIDWEVFTMIEFDMAAKVLSQEPEFRIVQKGLETKIHFMNKNGFPMTVSFNHYSG
jgi:hypothetical protein